MKKIPLWYYFGFPFIAILRLATLLYRLFWKLFTLRSYTWIFSAVKKMAVEMITWWWWWTELFLLTLTYYCGCMIVPMYNSIGILFDVEFIGTRASRRRRHAGRRTKYMT